MIGIALVEAATKALQVGVGFASHPDTLWASVRATAMARTGLQGATPDVVLLVTAGVPSQDAVPMIRNVLGPVGVAGGATSAIMTHNGALGAGALVLCLANGDGAVSGVAAAPGEDLADAAQGAARLILAGDYAGAMVHAVGSALVDEVLLRLFLITAVAWLLLRWHRVHPEEAAVVSVVGVALVQLGIYLPGILAAGFPTTMAATSFALVVVLLPAVVFGVLYWTRGFGTALVADATTVGALALLAV